MLIMKAVSRRNDPGYSATCWDFHGYPEQATWEVDLQYFGKVHLCTSHYKKFTEWECGNERKCNHINHGMGSRCVCGWIRPDTCRKCGVLSVNTLVKITEEREPHSCHSCNGSGRETGMDTCPACKGNPLAAPTKCVACYGRGRTYRSKQGEMCPTCDGSGVQRFACRTCKGMGSSLESSDKVCSTCNGSGGCSASDSNFGVDRIPLTDISSLKHRESLRPFVGQYLCFRCANPDWQFGAYREEEAQCEHRENLPGGDIERCKNMVAKNNPTMLCYRHIDDRKCRQCDAKLELDEMGGYCKQHARCGRCNQKPAEGSLFCEGHADYQRLGQMLEKTTTHIPESPVQILLAREKVGLKYEAICRKHDRTLDRIQSAKERIQELRKEFDVASVSKEDTDEAMRILARIEEIEDDLADAIGLLFRYRRLKEEFVHVVRFLRRVRKYVLWDPKSNPEYVALPDPKYDVLCKGCGSTFDRRSPMKYLCVKCTTKEKVDVTNYAAGSSEVRAAKMTTCRKCRTEFQCSDKKWTCPNCLEPGRINPKYRADCKNCEASFFTETLKFECRKCNTPGEILKEDAVETPMCKGCSRLPATVTEDLQILHCTPCRTKTLKLLRKGIDQKFVEMAFPTDNTPEFEHVLRTVCEVCRNEVPEVKPRRFILRDSYSVQTSIPAQIYFACRSCEVKNSAHGLILTENSRRVFEAEALSRESAAIRRHYEQEMSARLAYAYVMGKSLPSHEPMAPMGAHPDPYPLPPMVSIEAVQKERKEAKSKAEEGEVVRALARFKDIIDKDEPSRGEILELETLRMILVSKYRHEDLPKAKAK